MMRKNTIYITLTLIAVVLAAVLSVRLFTGGGGNPEPTNTPEIHDPVPEETPTPPPEATTPPTETLPPETMPPSTPTPTETAAPTTTPTTPPPTPTPTPTPTPVPAIVSGSFRSDTGTGLNLLVEWKIYIDATGNKKLLVDVSANSYALYTTALFESVELTVSGQTYKANSSAISYDGSTLRASLLASFTMDAPAGAADVTAVWHYRGVYSGVELEDITASGTVYSG